MQQQIRFCSTADGARIAYATVGSGQALIFAQWIYHLELEWEEPRVREFWETIVQHHRWRCRSHGRALRSPVGFAIVGRAEGVRGR
jgi:hypothetical protein